jgi:hypothetical protein
MRGQTIRTKLSLNLEIEKRKDGWLRDQLGLVTGHAASSSNSRMAMAKRKRTCTGSSMGRPRLGTQPQEP